MSDDHRQTSGQHGHSGQHASLWLASHGSRPVHRVGRRQFLTELGRNTFAIAVLGGFVAACSGDDDGASPSSTPSTSDGSTPDNTTPDDTTPDDTTQMPSTTDPAASSTPTTEPSDTGSNARWAQANLGFVSAYVLVRGSEAVVVDTGGSGSVAQIGTALSTLGATYEDVKHVVLTHSHPDHIGSLPGVLEAAPSATPYAGALDVPNISAPVEVTAVGDGDDVFGLQVIDTPGHTPGSISVFDPGIGLLLAGDAVNGNDQGDGLSGANEQFTADMATANTSVEKLARFEVDAIGMGHGQPVTSGAGVLLSALAAEL